MPECNHHKTATSPPDDQPYEVSAKGFDADRPGDRRVIGWTAHEDGGGLVRMVNLHPSMHSPKVRDIRPKPRAPFWADDFDLDLLKVFPDLPEILGNTIDLPVWTVGHPDSRNGRLNHPSTWNDGGALIWIEKPELTYDDHGWTSIDAHSTNEPVIECTWLEILRDQWVHSFGIRLLSQLDGVSHGIALMLAPPPSLHFSTIMSHRRNWTTLLRTPIEVAEAGAREWIDLSNRLMRNAADLPVG